MIPFLTYELLTPETADPVVIRITGQRERGFPDFRASNGVNIVSWTWPQYVHKYRLNGETEAHLLVVWGHNSNDKSLEIPLSDWPAVKQAIRELNEAKEYEEYVRSLKKLAQINKERDVETKKEEEKKRERFRQLFEKTERDMKNWPEWKRNITLLETSSTDKYKKEKDMSLKSEGERILNILKSSIEPTGDTYRDVVRLIENSLAENERLLNLYQQAVKGRQDFRNAYRKEKDRKSDRENISMKEDKYIFPLSEWNVREDRSGPWPACNVLQIVLTRKKPKVEDRENIPVKVEWRAKDLNSALGRNETAHFEDYGCYRIVQFRVTGWDAEDSYEYYDEENRLLSLCRTTPESSYHNLFDRHDLYIGLDAREKWSAPVLLPESIYKELDSITKALEQRANEVKG